MSFKVTEIFTYKINLEQIKTLKMHTINPEILPLGMYPKERI